ncbi:MAG TPA: siderophore-interacting protein [Vineibacter sp.]|nr:siderophore-interacting protein [Vineibacter sp.]
MTHASPYRLFDLVLTRRRPLTHSLSRLTFHGADVEQMATHAPDQRIKIFFPDATGQPAALPHRADWLAVYRALPPRARPPMRTYTIRHLRPRLGEVDIDFVLHGDGGPASRWASHARPGDAVQFVAPNRAHVGDVGGYEWKPPAATRHVLLIADETALPAVSGILESLAMQPSPPSAQAFIEVADTDDIMDLPIWPQLELTWLPRSRSPDGKPPMVNAIHRARLPAAKAVPATNALPDVDIESQILWDLAAPDDASFYAWIAGEAASVLAIRHHLVKECGMDRRSLNLMGYWRRGRALDDSL